MVKDEELMRRLCRAAAMSRRTPPDGDSPALPHGATPKGKGHGHILSALISENGMSQQELADRVGIRPQSLSEALLTLEEDGLIKRLPSPDDKRKTLVYVTDAGAEHSRLLAEERTDRARRLFAVLDENEKACLFMLLGKINAPRDS